MKKSKNLGFNTRAIHAGQEPTEAYGSIMTPIDLSTTFVQQSPGKYKNFDYSRAGNPTRSTFEACLASLEGARFAFGLSSGCSASNVVMHLVEAGEHIVAGDDMYGGTFRLFDKVMRPHGLEFDYVDMTNLAAIEKAITKKTKILWLETPTNPTLKIFDIEKISKIAKKKGVLLVVDNTFSSPYFQQPLSLGADIVVHSTTKYIGGHSDILGGAIITDSEELNEKLAFLVKSLGPVASPFDSYMALRSLKTLGIRMEAHQKNAMQVAEFLEKHKKVEKVLYPGLKSHPQHALAKAQMSGFSGMVTVYLEGGFNFTKKFATNLEIFALAESLGGVESLCNHPATMTHASIPADRRKALGIGDNLLRLSVGIEDAQDLIDDLDRALKLG